MTKEKEKSAVMKGDMTVGNPLKVILAFALPILLGNLFQQFYNLADTRIAGKFLGDDALAAISSTGSIYGVIIGMANGMNNGCAIVVARLFGARDFAKMRRAIAHMLLIDIGAAVIFTGAGLIFLKPLMRAIATPEELFEAAYVYIAIIIGGILTTILYNMGAGILRSVGDSRTPLIFLIITSLANIALDITFVLAFDIGVAGIALATVCAQGISVVLCFFYIAKRRPELHIKRSDFKFDSALFADLTMMGLSMGLISSLVSFGSFALQRAINGFDKATIIGNSAARKLDGLFMLPLSTLGTAAATFVGQNFGARRFERISKAIKSSLLAGFIWSTLGVVVIYIFGAPLVKLLTASDNEATVARAVEYMRINIPFFYVLTALFIFRSSLQGLGKKVIPIISGAIELAFKFLAAAALAPAFGYIGVCVAEPTIWTLSAIVVIAVFIYDMKKLRSKPLERLTD